MIGLLVAYNDHSLLQGAFLGWLIWLHVTQSIRRDWYRSAITFRNRYRACRCPGYRLLDGLANLIFDSPHLVFPHIINACVFSSAFSSGNTILFGSSRILYGLALRGHAPKVFTQCTKGGLPFLAILICVCSTTPIFWLLATYRWWAGHLWCSRLYDRLTWGWDSLQVSCSTCRELTCWILYCLVGWLDSQQPAFSSHGS